MLCKRQIKPKSTILKRPDAVQETVKARPAILKRLAMSVRCAEWKRSHVRAFHGARAASFKACVAVKIKQVEKVKRFAIAGQGGLVWRLNKAQARDGGVECLRDAVRKLNKLDKAARWAAKRETPCHSVSFQSFTGMPGHDNALSSHTTGGHRGNAKERCRFQHHVLSNHVAPCQTLCCKFCFLLGDGCRSFAQWPSLTHTCGEKCQITGRKNNVSSRTCNS